MRDKAEGVKTFSIYKWGLVAIGVAAVLGCLYIWGYPVMNPDPLTRYAPMARRFAEGDWINAFHPRFGVLFQAITGSLVCLTGWDAMAVCQLVATTFFALTIVPLAYLSTKLFKDSRVTTIAIVLYLLSPRLTWCAMEGMRDPLRFFAFLLALSAFLMPKGGWLAMAVGAFIQITLKIDAFVIGWLLTIAFAFRCWCIRRWWQPLPALASATFGTYAVCFMVHAYTGWWVPAPQYMRLLERLVG